MILQGTPQRRWLPEDETMVRRREFMMMISAAAAGWPAASRAQQRSRAKRIGVLAGFAQPEEARPDVTTLEKNLQARGWRPGENVQIDYRFASNDNRRTQAYARELVALGPDVLLGVGTGNLVALSQQTRTIPIVFMQVTNPE